MCINLILGRCILHIELAVTIVFGGGQKAFKITKGFTENLVNLVSLGRNPI